MLIAIMQPTYWPWMGYFDMIDQVDAFVFLDSVQLVKRSWGVRNRIKSPNGELTLTIPVKSGKGRDETFYCNGEIDYTQNWVDSHLRSIRMNYARATHLDTIMEVVESHYRAQTAVIGDFHIRLISEVCRRIGITTPLSRSSDMTVSGTKDDLLVDICRQKGASTYLSAPGSAQYIEKDSPAGAFGHAGIELRYHQYRHPEYEQPFGDFLPYMGLVDLLANVGWKDSLEVIRSGRHKSMPYQQFRESLNVDGN